MFHLLEKNRDREHKKREGASQLTTIANTDYLSLSEITFEWGDSYDDKDWMRLRAILAPTLMVRHLFIQTPLEQPKNETSTTY